MTPRQMVTQVRKATAGWKYDVVSIGYPGPVLHGKPVNDPKNLGRGWVGFNFKRAFGCPVKVINDAAMQALGSYRGGRMLFLGLGTGLGCALIVDDVLEPMELAHLPYKKGRTYEEYVGEAGRKRLGKTKWRRSVIDVVNRLEGRARGQRCRPRRRKCQAHEAAAGGRPARFERARVRRRVPLVGSKKGRPPGERAMTAQITRLLHDWRSGDRDALDRLIPLVYDELRVIASRHMSREWRGAAIQTTALVNEAYVKLAGQRSVDWQNRAHFFAIAARVMRRILLDDARSRLREKRGGGMPTIAIESLSVSAADAPVDSVDLIAIDRALQELERLDADQARIVELRFFGGMTVEETGEVLGISPATVKREWALAKGWLHRMLTTGTGSPS